MPQASEDLRKKWGGYDGIGEDKAIKFLESCGYVLKRDWTWEAPHPPTSDEIEAMAFLIDEWDFGGISNALL